MSFYITVLSTLHGKAEKEIGYWNEQIAEATANKRMIDKIEKLSAALTAISGVTVQLQPLRANHIELTLKSEFLFDEVRDRVNAAGWATVYEHPGIAPKNGFRFYMATDDSEGKRDGPLLLCVAFPAEMEVAA